MRGKAVWKDIKHAEQGITPACAGKSLTIQKMSTLGRDHPRVCGEKYARNGILFTLRGSPPRVRGKVCMTTLWTSQNGITPACAGKSITAVLPSQIARDHPRVCGEKQWKTCRELLSQGSPPRVRGKACHSCRDDIACGITPACAGKRLKRSHRIGHFSCILCLFHSVLHRASVSGGSRAGPCAPPCLPAQNAVPV